MTGHGEKLSRKREQAIAALLQHPSVVAAAKATKLSERTLRRWLKDEAFIEAYEIARRECLSHATGRLQEATSRAIDTLKAVMGDAEARSAQVSAARVILEYAFRAVEVEDLEARLKALEARNG
jgi:hypothetical protein